MNVTEGSLTDVATTVGLYVGIVGVGGPLVWVLAEVLKAATSVKNELRFAVPLGVLYGMLFLVFGWLPLLPTIFGEGSMATMVVNFIWAGLSGLASTWLAKFGNDKLMKPRRLKLSPK